MRDPVPEQRRISILVWLTGGGILVLWAVCFIITLIGNVAFSGPFGDTFGVLNTLFSGLAFGAVAWTLWYQVRAFDEQRRATDAQHEALQDQLEQRAEATAELAQRFFDGPMREARQKADDVRKKFLSKKIDRAAFARLWVDSDGPVMDGEHEVDSWGTSTLIEYYCWVLYHVNLTRRPEDKAKLVGTLTSRYLWPYWRGYLLKLADEVEAQYNTLVVATDERAQYPLVSWVADLRELNRLSGLPPYDLFLHPMDRQYAPAIDFSRFNPPPGLKGKLPPK